MENRTLDVPYTHVTVDRASPLSLARQLYDGLRGAILQGRLAAGVRLPSTRTMARDAGISRNTVMTVFEQLIAEGYLEARVGAGTFVVQTLAESHLLRPDIEPASAPRASVERTFSRLGSALAKYGQAAMSEPRQGALQPGRPDIEHFPFDVWKRLTSRVWQRRFDDLARGSGARGYRPLREAIAGYLGATRGVQCTSEQVMVTAGTQQGLTLMTRVLLDHGDAAWIEDPGYANARHVLQAGGANLVPISIDAEGMSVGEGLALRSDARIAYVTPSHQFPMGVTMSVTRRLALLDWAARAGAWILEDDYDSEFRFGGHPITALQGLDSNGRVIYLGTFSKVLFPSLRLGYMILPPDLVGIVTAAQNISNGATPLLQQAVLADFLFEGHFERHVRRMRAVYAERHAVLIDAASRNLGGLLHLRSSSAGLHILGTLNEGVDDVVVTCEATLRGVRPHALSPYRIRQVSDPGGVILGFAASTPEQIREGVKELAAAIEDVQSRDVHVERR